MARPRKTNDALGKVFGLGVKRVRERQGLKQEALAFEVGYGDRSQIAKIETGKTVPSLDKALRLAATLQVPLEAFMVIGRGEIDAPEKGQLGIFQSRMPRSPLSYVFSRESSSALLFPSLIYATAQ